MKKSIRLFLFLIVFCFLPLQATDFLSIYQTDKWDNQIEMWVDLHAKRSLSPRSFSNSFVPEAKKEIETLLLMNHKDIATKLVCDLISVLDRKRLSFVNESIAAYLYGLDIPLGERSVLAERLLRGLKLLGKPAAAIEGISQTRLEKGKLIILFYDTDCGNCNIQLADMIKKYPSLRKKGYDVISISSDDEKTIYEKKAKTFPWTTKLCDYNSFEGVNFLQYGVVSTPSFFLIDENGILTHRTNTFVELLNQIKY